MAAHTDTREPVTVHARQQRRVTEAIERLRDLASADRRAEAGEIARALAQAVDALDFSSFKRGCRAGVEAAERSVAAPPPIDSTAH